MRRVHAGLGACGTAGANGCPELRSTRGFTLIEMLVAMLILGVLLSATGSALINFTRASVTNERRVQSTALLNRLHEEMQALPWTDAAVYEDEVADIPVESGMVGGVALDLAAGTFDGQPLVLLDGPDCPVGDPDCRVETVPRAYEAVLDDDPDDGFDYEVIRIVTWADRDGVAAENIKRFTTIVRWPDGTRTIEERFDSERAPSPGELSEGNPSVQFLAVPSDVELDVDGRNVQPIELTGDFSLVGSILSAEVSFVAQTLDAATGTYTPTDESVTLTRVAALSERFTGQIPAGAHVFAEGSQEFLLVGTGADNDFGTQTSVTFVPAGGTDLAGTPPEIVQVFPPSPSSLVIGDDGKDKNILCQDVVIRALVDNVRPGVTVLANYKTSSGDMSLALKPTAVLSGGTNEFAETLPAGSFSEWLPTAGNPVPGIVFAVQAQNTDSVPVSDENGSMNVSFTTNKNKSC